MSIKFISVRTRIILYICTEWSKFKSRKLSFVFNYSFQSFSWHEIIWLSCTFNRHRSKTYKHGFLIRLIIYIYIRTYIIFFFLVEKHRFNAVMTAILFRCFNIGTLHGFTFHFINIKYTYTLLMLNSWTWIHIII